MQRATAVGWSWPGSRSSKEPFEEVARQVTQDGRAVVFRNFDRGLEESMWQKMLPALETILVRFHAPVIITSNVDPCQRRTRRAADGGKPHCKVRRDVNSHPRWYVPEASVKIPDMIAEEAYYDWLLSDRRKKQKLLLTQLAEEKIVNPNRKAVAEELINRGC